jgi:hypothetical protein
MDMNVDTSCSSLLEGIAFCLPDDVTITVCSGGNWFDINCDTLLGGGFCGDDLTGDPGCWPNSDM